MPNKKQSTAVRRILDAAASCFAEGGLHATSLKAVADAAGVSKALIHYHFENKESLLVELERDLYMRIAGEIRSVAIHSPPGLTTAMQALDRLTEAVVQLTPLTPVFLELAGEALRSGALGERLHHWVAEAESIVERAIHETLGPDVDRLAVPPGRTASLLLAIIHGISLSGMHFGEAAIRARFADLKALLATGLLTQPSSDAPSAETERGHGRNRTGDTA